MLSTNIADETDAIASCNPLEPCPTMLLGTNRIIGGIRVRQQRVYMHGSCSELHALPPGLQEAFPTCRTDFSWQEEDTAAYGADPEFIWQAGDHVLGENIWGGLYAFWGDIARSARPNGLTDTRHHMMDVGTKVHTRRVHLGLASQHNGSTDAFEPTS